MGYPRATSLQQCLYLIKRKLKDLLDMDREDPMEPVYTKLPDGTFLVTWRPKEGRKE